MQDFTTTKSFRYTVVLFVMALIVAPAIKAITTNLPLNVGSVAQGDGLGSAADTSFKSPQDVAVLGDDAFVTDRNNYRIVGVSLENGDSREVLDLTGTSQAGSIVVCDDGLAYFATFLDGVFWFDPSLTTPSASLLVAPISKTYLNYVSKAVTGLACSAKTADDRLFISTNAAIREYNRATNSYTGWQMTNAAIGDTTEDSEGGGLVRGLALSPDLQYLAFGTADRKKVGTIHIATKAVTWYPLVENAPSVAWTADGRTIVLVGTSTFLRFIDFQTGSVTYSATSVLPTNSGSGLALLDSAGLVIVTYLNGLTLTQVDGASSPCDAVPSVVNSDGGNATSGVLGDTVAYACSEGFTAAGSTQISTCDSGGKWSDVICQSEANVINGLLANSTNVKSTLEEVAQSFGLVLTTPLASQDALRQWCKLRRDFEY